MDYSNLIIAICSGIGVVISLYTFLSKRFDQIDDRFIRMQEDMDSRFNKVDEQFQRIDEKLHRMDEKFDRMDEKFEGRFSKIDEKLDKIQEDVSDVKERLSFLEASSIYTMPSEPPKPTTRSEIAKAMWRKRRSKQIEKK